MAKSKSVSLDLLLSFTGGAHSRPNGQAELDYEVTSRVHAKEYGLICCNPLYVKTIIFSKDYIVKGGATALLQYMEKDAIKNRRDCIFGHISESMILSSGDMNISFFCDFLSSNGYSVNLENYDFYKKIILP